MPVRVLHLVGGKSFQGGTASVVRDLVKTNIPGVSSWIWMHRDYTAKPGLPFVCTGISETVNGIAVGDLLGALVDVSSLLRAIKQLNISVLHAHSRLGIFVGWFAQRISGLPLIVHLHFLARRPWIYRFIIRTSGANVIYNSRLTARHYGADPMRSHVVMPTVDWPTPNLPSSKSARVVCASALYPDKHLDVVVEACSVLAKEGCKLEVVIYGRTPDCSGGVYELKVMKMIGETPFVKLERWDAGWSESLGDRDVFVHLGQPESFGLVILEAFARGLRLVVLKKTFLQDLPGSLSDDGIYRSDDLSVVSVAKAIRRALQSEVSSFSLYEERSAVASQFSKRTAAEKVSSVYQALGSL